MPLFSFRTESAKQQSRAILSDALTQPPDVIKSPLLQLLFIMHHLLALPSQKPGNGSCRRALTPSSKHTGVPRLPSSFSVLLRRPLQHVPSRLAPTCTSSEPAATTTEEQQPAVAAAAAGQSAESSNGESSASSTAPAVPEQAAAPKKGGGLAKRVIFGCLLGAVGGFAVFHGKLLYLATLLLIAYQTTQEYYTIHTSKQVSQGFSAPPAIFCVLTTILSVGITFATYVSQGRSGMALSVSSLLLLAMHIVVYKVPKFSHMATAVFGLFYCGYLPSFWIKLRSISLPGPELPWPALAVLQSNWTVGLLATLATILCVVAADTGAYFVGKNLGRTKLTDVSPKKTVEGAVGGLASSIAMALALHKLVGWPAAPLEACALGVLIFFSSIFGDLIESIMKREAGVKDSGDLIPGHGGLLDRFDSYMFTGAVTFFYVMVGMQQYGLA